MSNTFIILMTSYCIPICITLFVLAWHWNRSNFILRLDKRISLSIHKWSAREGESEVISRHIHCPPLTVTLVIYFRKTSLATSRNVQKVHL